MSVEDLPRHRAEWFGWRVCKQRGCTNDVWGMGTAREDEPRNCPYHEGYEDGQRELVDHLARVAEATKAGRP